MNAATAGGCVASSCPYFDLPVSLLVLDAKVVAQGPAGSREIGLESFFPGPFENALDPAEFVTGLRVPRPGNTTTSAFTKLETNANDLAIVNVAVSLETDGAGNCERACAFVNGVGGTPARLPSAEGVLAGAVLGKDVFASAGEAAKTDVEPFADHRASAEYRSVMIGVLLQRTLESAAGRLGQQGGRQ
jgi:CO/xanthine dehydrogenase FAD-binding subunit